MGRPFAVATLVLLFALALGHDTIAASRARPRTPAVRPRDFLGAWEIVWPSVAPQRQVKLITPTHFSWTAFDPATHHVSASGGGAWTLVDGVYCEQLDFALGGVESAAGRVLCFRLEVRGDSLLQVNADTAGPAHTREVWRRLR